MQKVFGRSYSICRSIFDAFVGREVIAPSYSSSTLEVLPKIDFKIKTVSRDKEGH